MRIKVTTWAITAAAVGIAAPVARTAVAAPQGAKTVHCRIHDFIQNFPSASRPGETFSLLRCSGPFGRGVQHATFTTTPKTATTGKAVLKFKAYFDTGSVSGVWRADYKFTSRTMGTFHQKVSWTGGTGAFKHIKATGTGTGIQNGMQGIVTQRLTVTGV
jgi:hypothetical protein